MKIGSILRAERERAGGAIAAMAVRCQVSRPYLVNIEAGRKRPTPRIVAIYGEVYPAVFTRREVIAFLAAATVTPAVLAADLDRALAASTATRSADDWTQLLHTRARDYMTISKVKEVRDALPADLALIRTGPDDPELLAITAQLATLYGQTCPSLIGDGGALAFYRHGVSYADLSGHTTAQVWCRARSAQALEAIPGQRERALHWANEAVAIADGPSTGLVWAHLTRATLAARDDRQLLAELHNARRVLDHVAVDEARSDQDITLWRHLIRESGILAGYGHPRARAVTEEAMNLLPSHNGFRRYRVHLELHHAAIDHDAGDRKGALQRAQQAIQSLPPEQHSGTILRFVRELERPIRTRQPITLKRQR